MTRATILLAGGGTGGHVFPLVAVADALGRLAPEVSVVFVGTERGIETRVVPERGYELELMEVAPIRGGGWSGAAHGVGRAAAAVPAAWRLVGRRMPRAVLSVGGYAAGPVSLAARLRGIPLALLEPNAAIGLSNQILARFVKRAYTAFAETERHFSPGAVLRAGVPLRSGFERRSYPGPQRVLQVLVLGGSQGARTLNEVVPRALAAARSPVRVVHQCGRGNDDAVRARYAELQAGGRATVVPFIDDMPAALEQSDLVISRAGASAVSEICAVGRPSLLVPYPYAAAQHQLHNARAVERAGAGVCLPNDATHDRLAAEIDRLAATTGLLRTMAGRARELGRPDAADTIARDLLTLAQVGHTEQAPPDRSRAGGSRSEGADAAATAAGER